MKKKTFKPEEWLNKPQTKAKKEVKIIPSTNNLKLQDNSNDIEKYILEIEQSAVDITSDYSTWINIGFAFADEYGESGRDYFHRVSKFHLEYDSNKCNNQYDKCLNSKGTGIHIATFFHHTKNAGISIKKEYSNCNNTYNNKVYTNKENDTNQEMPTFPQPLFPQLPQFLKRAVEPASSDEERDILLLGTITSISACLPKISGIYDGHKVYPNLFLFITALASAGKGRLNLCKKIVYPIHRSMREQTAILKDQHTIDLAKHNSNNEKIEKPQKPPERMLFIPANNSSTGVFQLLSDNKGKGLIFETEGDTLSNAFKTDYGNYSDGFRKAFHHENISYYRRTDREFVDIEEPCLSTVLSGTPNQVATLIPNAENGLFSRFIFYFMNINHDWKNVFEAKTINGLDKYYSDLGEEFLEFYNILKNNSPIQVILTKEQESKFNDFFSNTQNEYIDIQPDEFIATIRRLGIIAFRFMMVFTALRIEEDGDINSKRECEDVDFNNAITMIKVLIKHSSRVFTTLPKNTAYSKTRNRKNQFLESLPYEFTTEIYKDKANELNINSKTAEGYITTFIKSKLIERLIKGNYINLSKKDSKGTESLRV